MNTTNNSQIELRNIFSLSGLSFIVPDYQRGYRWTATEAVQMLNDFRDFYKRKKQDGEFYCLQPIVVQKREDGSYELIDGQQRLTTLYIILKSQTRLATTLYEGFDLYSIKYETRHESEDFLDQIGSNAEEAEKYIDFHYMYEAYNAINKWIEERKKAQGDNTEIRKLLDTLLQQQKNENDGMDIAHNVRLIWYEVDRTTSGTSQSPIDIFTRLNIGKIPLSNSELIRALLLRHDNFPNDKSGLLQNRIASQWNQIEQTLQNDNFWYFINGKGNPTHYDNRIELIFDLMAERSRDSQFYHTFLHFSNELNAPRQAGGKEHKTADDIWKEVMEYFQTLDEWYDDRTLYHYIGFLVDNATNGNDEIRELLDISKKSDKDVFVDKIEERIKEVMKDCRLSEISYGETNTKARKVLLLFNIITLLRVDKSDARFPFGKYKTEKWDIEHVCSQVDKIPSSDNQRRVWLDDMVDYFSKHGKEDDSAFMEELKSAHESAKTKIDEDEFDNLFKQISHKFNENQIEDRDSLGNLTLLDAQTNRSYGNAFFPIKRQYIIQNDESGVFVPIATKNLFLKYYSTKPKDIMTWSQEDADDYFTALETTLSEYLPK